MDFRPMAHARAGWSRLVRIRAKVLFDRNDIS
jgi:hypothetical protein